VHLNETQASTASSNESQLYMKNPPPNSRVPSDGLWSMILSLVFTSLNLMPPGPATLNMDVVWPNGAELHLQYKVGSPPAIDVRPNS
jgi:hypothetical protein